MYNAHFMFFSEKMHMHMQGHLQCFKQGLTDPGKYFYGTNNTLCSKCIPNEKNLNTNFLKAKLKDHFENTRKLKSWAARIRYPNTFTVNRTQAKAK